MGRMGAGGGSVIPARITLSRAKGYRRPDGTVQVDRATIFGNPWQVGNPGIWWLPRNDNKAGWIIGYDFGLNITQADAVTFYREWLDGRFMPPSMPPCLNGMGQLVLWTAMHARRSAILARLPSLTGHPLGCRCKPGEPCHADVLLELANK